MNVSRPIRIFALVALLAALAMPIGFFVLGSGEESSAATSSLLTPKRGTQAGDSGATPLAAKPKAKPKAKAKEEKELAGPHGLPIEIENALVRSEAVVVALYSPEGQVDEDARLEAEAGATLAGVTFVDIDVTRQSEAAPLAAKLGVLHAPSILIFTSTNPDEPAFRINGFADRDTVAQAAANVAPPAVGKSAIDARWAAQANAICNRTYDEVDALGVPSTPAQMLAIAPKLQAIGTRTISRLKALKPPTGQEARVRKLIAMLARAVAIQADGFAALRRNDKPTYLQKINAAGALGLQADELAIALGAEACTKNPFVDKAAQ